MLKVILLLVSYLLGSIPFGFIAVYLVKRADIRTLGSGNIGATNVTRILGKKWGTFVFALDFLKGIAGPYLIYHIFGKENSLFIVLAGILVVCGHNWTIFLKFKGGKGVATSCGVIVLLSFIFPQLRMGLIIALASWVIVLYVFKYVSAASLLASGIFFTYSLIVPLPLSIKVFSFILFVFIVMRHKSNIKNLLNKKENKF